MCMYSSDYLNIAQAYANVESGCLKVKVGSAIVIDGRIVALGANRAMPDLCKYAGCLRVQKYGDDNKTHRNPDDCRAIHSEIDALSSCIVGDLSRATIYVTRYPCEACARAIAASGIKSVVYGRNQPISDMTKAIFESNYIEYRQISNWDAPDKTN